VPHFFRPGQRWNSSKFKVWYFLGLREQNNQFSPMTVGELAYWTGVNVRSLSVLVIKWRSPSWRRVLKRKLPDGTLGYVLGYKGRRWLTECPRFIPEHVRDQWLQEVVDYQQETLVEHGRINP
jgi:hypothetical protein